MTEESGVAEAGGTTQEGATWHVQVFEIRKTVARLLGGRKRVTTGFGWSASGNPEGYEYHPGPFKTREAAVAAARSTVEELGGTVSDVTESGVPIDLEG